MAVRTGLYLRVSSFNKSAGLSIPSQLARLREDTERASEVVVETFVDQAKTGTSAKKRPEYQRLLQWVREGRLDKIRIESVDRGHRNELDRREFERELQKYSVILQYAGEQEKTPPAVRNLNRAIRGAVAELEAGQASERVYKRLLFKFQRGEWVGGRTPYGLRLDGKGWVEPDPETYPVLLYILRRRGAGAGYGKITDELNTGISIDDEPPFVPETPMMRMWKRRPVIIRQNPETGEFLEEARERPKGLWHRATVRRICEAAVNGVYAGIVDWGAVSTRFADDSDGNPKQRHIHNTGKPFVPEDILDAVRAIEVPLIERRGRKPKYQTYLVKPTCGLCGAPMGGAAVSQIWKSRRDGTPKRYSYRRYICTSNTSYSQCKAQRQDATYIEQYVIERVSEHLQVTSPAELAAAVEEVAQKVKISLERGLQDILALIQDAEYRRDQALDVLMRHEGHISERLQEEYIRRSEDAVQEVDSLEGKKRTLEAGLIRLEDDLCRVRLNILQPLADATLWTDPEQREVLKRALALLVKKVVVYPAPHGARPERIDVELASVTELL